MIWTRGSLFAVGTILLFLGLAMASLLWLDAIRHDLQREMGESNLWAATQAERESLHFLSLLTSGDDPDATALQFELLYSRFVLLSDNPQRAFLTSIGEEERLERGVQLLAELDSLRVDGDATIASQRGRAIEIAALAHDMAQATYLSERRRGIALRERLLRATTLLRVAVIGGFAAGMVLASLLLRDKRRLLRSAEALQAYQLGLEQTIAERTEALREALEVETRAKEVYRNFVVTVAHQFRTSVSVIHLTAQRQVRSPDEALAPETRRRFVRILDAAARLERLIGGFLDSAVIEQRAIEAHHSRIDFNAVASVAVAQTRAAHPDRRVICRFSCEALLVDGDAVLLEQVVLNLLSNAIKYSAATDPVEVTTRLKQGRILCTVSDHGCGIPPEAQAAIFERFYRAPNAHRHPGLGVGLSLAAQIVRLHGGEIAVRSDIGRGTDFTLSLPSPSKEAYDPSIAARHDPVH
ncbi:sensor histidine kinase KdpD [Pararhodobacter sp. CCB-MM2]|uniref:sensor histidine kinase n=1 Tax=Pararhodobacter sp. CCB-MM2 TaxID=1786003 RepID=UPI000836E6C9|nr:HAMP domain-containing sensor histidine kinase [Pararhodobacter sp. CCB-MM2]